MALYVRVQEKGQVTIPTILRKKHDIKKGDMVMVVETKDGLLIKPVKIVLTEALDEIGKALKADGVTLEQWNKRGREIREKLIEEIYEIKDKS